MKVSFTHNIQKGDTLVGILSKYVPEAKNKVFEAAFSGGIPTYSLKEWAKRTARTESDICSQIARHAARFSEAACNKLKFVNLQVGQSITGYYDDESGEIALNVEALPNLNLKVGEVTPEMDADSTKFITNSRELNIELGQKYLIATELDVILNPPANCPEEVRDFVVRKIRLEVVGDRTIWYVSESDVKDSGYYVSIDALYQKSN